MKENHTDEVQASFSFDSPVLMPVISLIVPVYNVEAYLDRCVESIEKQTYKDYECTLVDDGSRDGSARMCEEWSLNDSRILVIHKENGGLSDARNAGLSIASGIYVSFVDSDDLIHPQMLELLHQELASHYADVAECGFLKFSDYNDIPSEAQTVQDTIELTPEHALAELILERKIHQIACGKLYRRKLLAGNPFPKGKICEDEFWTYRIIGKATQIIRFSTMLYFYFQRDESIIHTYSLKRLHCIEAFEERLKYVEKYFPSLYMIANKSYLSACFYHFQKLCAFPQVDADCQARKELLARFQNGDLKALFSLANWKYRIWYRIFLNFPFFTCKVRNLLRIGL